MAKKGEYVLSIGDDNVVLTRLEDRKVVNAWLASPDPASALEELGEALAADKKGRVSLMVDTLDQAFKEEEIPKVGILDRRKVLSRHITMAFPGQTMRGARLVGESEKKTLIYEFASVPLDGRIPGWLEFYESLPNEKGGVFALAAENVDLITALAPKDAPVPEKGNHWRHFIGVNVTGGLRQIIQKNGRLSLTRLTQAPPPETPPEEFADMIVRDFKATITYLRRLGYAVGDPLDLVVLTTEANRRALEDFDWEGARSVTVYTPNQAAAMLGIGAIGPEDQAHCDVLHAAWFTAKRRAALPLTRSVAMGDARDDMRELAFAASPFVAGLTAVAVLAWTGFTGYEYFTVSRESEGLRTQLSQATSRLEAEQAKIAQLPQSADAMRNAFSVEEAMDKGGVDMVPAVQVIYRALQSDAIALDFDFVNGKVTTPGSMVLVSAGGAARDYAVGVRMRLASVITRAEEAVQVAARIRGRLSSGFGAGYNVEMTREPVAAQASDSLSGGLASAGDSSGIRRDEPFYVEFVITKSGTP
ncbi:MAG: hypothetical protein SFV21_10915 [Rhodospirillaceae bacterium]|nr:hypothetical protein [Rhodospirillaceae bacterium]